MAWRNTCSEPNHWNGFRLPGIVSYVVVSIHQGMELEVNLMHKMSLNTAMFVYWVLWVLVFSVVMCSLYYGFDGHQYHK